MTDDGALTAVDETRRILGERVPSYLLQSLAIAVPLTAAFYLGLHLLGDGTYVDLIFTERGSIPYTTTYLTFVALVQLSGLLLHLRREVRNLETVTAAVSAVPAIDRSSAGALGVAIREKVAPRDRRGLVFARLESALYRVESTGNPESVSAFLSEQAEIDRALLSNAYGTVRFVAWLIPVLGFVGTVSGISLAIASFPELMKGGSEAMPAIIDSITKNLGVAFDTTLIALLQIALVMFLLYEVQKRGSSLLNGYDEFCLHGFLGRVREEKGLQAGLPEPYRTVAEILSRQADALEAKFEAAVGRVAERLVAAEKERWDGIAATFRAVTREHQDALRATGEALQAESRGFSDRLQQAQGAFRSSLADAVAALGKADADRARETARVLDEAGARVAREIASGVERSVAACDRVVATQGQTAGDLRAALARIEQLLQSGEQLRALQQALQANLEALARTGEVRRALEGLGAEVGRLTPVLAELQKRRSMQVRIVEEVQGDGGPPP